MNRFLFFFMSTFFMAQTNLQNITNQCGYTNSSTNNNQGTIMYSGYLFEKTSNFLIYKAFTHCQNGQDNSISVSAYDGINPPYKLKYESGEQVNDIGELSGELVKVNDRIFFNKRNPNTYKFDKLYFFDEAISSDKVNEVNTDNFPVNGKEFTQLVKYQNGFFYSGDTDTTFFLNTDNNNSLSKFSEPRHNNFWQTPRIFTNAVYNGNLFFTSGANPGNISTELRKFNVADNTISTITFSENDPYGSYPIYLTVCSNKLFFINKTTQYGTEIFYYDESTGNINCLDLNPGVANSDNSFLTVLNDKLYFLSKLDNKIRVYKYDGVNPPVVIYEEIFTEAYGSKYSYTGITVHNNKIYFVRSLRFPATSDDEKTEIFSYNETEPTAVLATTLAPFTTSRFSYNILGFIPQFNEYGRSTLISFKNDLYIVGFEKKNGYFSGEDIFKISPESLTTNENFASDNLVLYPNPATDEINIRLPKTYANIKVETYDYSQNILKSDSFHNLDLLKLKTPTVKGNYIIKINADNHIYYSKFIRK